MRNCSLLFSVSIATRKTTFGSGRRTHWFFSTNIINDLYRENYQYIFYQYLFILSQNHFQSFYLIFIAIKGQRNRLFDPLRCWFWRLNKIKCESSSSDFQLSTKSEMPKWLCCNERSRIINLITSCGISPKIRFNIYEFSLCFSSVSFISAIPRPTFTFQFFRYFGLHSII